MHVNRLLSQVAPLPPGHRKNTAVRAGFGVFFGVVATGQGEGAGELFVLDECAVLQTVSTTAIPNRLDSAQFKSVG